MKDYSIKSIRNEFKSKGVFYTPKELGEKLKSLVDIEYSNVYDPTCGSYVIIMTVVKSLIKSRVLVLLQNIKILKNSNLCVV